MKFKKMYSLTIVSGFSMLMGMFNLPKSLPFVYGAITVFAISGGYNVLVDIVE